MEVEGLAPSGPGSQHLPRTMLPPFESGWGLRFWHNNLCPSRFSSRFAPFLSFNCVFRSQDLRYAAKERRNPVG